MVREEYYTIEEMIPKEHAIGGSVCWTTLPDTKTPNYNLAADIYNKLIKQKRIVRLIRHTRLQCFSKLDWARNKIK